MAQKRIDFFGQFAPTTIDTSVAESLKALAGVGQSVSNIAMPIAKRALTEKAMQEGGQVQRDEQGGIIAPKERTELTFYDRAYNEAAMLAYRAEVKRDTKQTLNKLRNQYQDDPQGFEFAANAYRDGILKDMPDNFAFVLGEDIQNSIANYSVDVQNEAFKRQREQSLASITDSVLDLNDDISNFARSGNEEGLKNAIAERKALFDKGVAAGLINPAKAELEHEKLEESVTVNKAIGGIERLFEQEIPLAEKVALAERAMSEDLPDLSPEQKDALVSAMQATVNEQVKKASQLTAEQEKQIALQTVELQLDAQFSRRPAADIQADAFDMFNRGSISEKEYKGIVTDVIQAQRKQMETSNLDIKVSQRLAGDDSVLLSQKEVDDFYERNMEGLLDDMEQGERVPLLANYVTLTGSMPGRLAQRISNNLRSQDVDKIAESADLIDRLDDIRGIDSGIKSNDRAFASIVTNMAGVMSSEQAIDYATQLTDPRNKQRIEAREAEIKEEEFDYLDFVEDDFDELDGVSTAALTKEYKDTFELHFKAGMDESEAKAVTSKLLKRNWKYSDSSDRMMKYPPEDYYAVSGDTRYIKNELGRYVSKNFMFDQAVERSFLVSDQETSRLASKGQPDYLVMVELESGELMTLSAVDPKDGKTKIIRWSPDVEAQQKKQTKKNIEMGEALREKAQPFKMPTFRSF